jgi:hypothetical protein
LSEEQFWKRYFQSKLFNAHRASIRSSATQHVVKDDPIFDKYLERDDDGECLYFFIWPKCLGSLQNWSQGGSDKTKWEFQSILVQLWKTMERYW